MIKRFIGRSTSQPRTHDNAKHENHLPAVIISGDGRRRLPSHQHLAGLTAVERRLGQSVRFIKVRRGAAAALEPGHREAPFGAEGDKQKREND